MLSVDEITNLVRARKNATASIEIKRLLNSSSDPEMIFRACEWYWAMGRLRDAFLLLRLTDGFPSRQSAETFDGRRLLWGARFLNNMGASHFAIELAKQIEPSKEEHFWILGNIYLSNRFNDEALLHFERMEQVTADRDDRWARFRIMMKASALAAVGRFDEAVAVMHEVLMRTPEPTLNSHMKAVLGGILVQAGEFTEALEILHQAEEGLAYIKDLPDFGFLCKWIGYAYAKTDRLEVADGYFANARRILFTPAHRPEPFLDVLQFEAQVRSIEPEWIERKSHYPGHTPAAQNYFGQKESCWFGSPGAEIEIALESDEYSTDGRSNIGVPKELLLLAHLRIVGDWGINGTRMQSVLWPEEVFAFSQLNDRLKKLLKRLRSIYDFDIEVASGHLTLGRKDLDRIAVHSGGSARPGLLEGLRRDDVFSSSDVESKYGISKTQASKHIQKWVGAGFARKSGSGRNTVYVVS